MNDRTEWWLHLFVLTAASTPTLQQFGVVVIIATHATCRFAGGKHTLVAFVQSPTKETIEFQFKAVRWQALSGKVF